MEFDLNMHTARLLMSEPFFAALSRNITKRASNSIPTAGVRVNEETGQFEMIYNPEFFSKLPEDHVRGVLKHEFYHLIFGHVTGDRFHKATGGKMTKIWNVATDLAINSHLVGELPELACIPGQNQFANFPLGKSAEWYHEELKKEQNKDDSDGEGEEGEGSDDNNKNNNSSGEADSFDDHSGWGEASQEAKEIAKQRLKEIVKKAATEADKSSNWGTVSSQVRQQIRESLVSKIDWRKVLRYFVKTSQKANKSTSIKRINRRYAYVHPGKKIQRQAKIAISIDQSGSVDDSMLEAFYAELNKLSEIAEFTVIPFDDKVFEEKVYVWKKGEKKKKERVLCGGTNFDAPTEYVNKLNFDGHIILTDMMAPKPKRSNCQRMWMTTEYCARRPYFQTNERVIAVVD